MRYSMAKTDTPEIMLGRYHAREVTLAQLQRRRLEAAENLSSAKKAMKKLKAEAPAEGTEIERRRWLEKIGEQELEVDKLTAEKAAAEQALNAHIGNKALPLFGADPDRVAKDCISGGMVLLFEQGYSRESIEEVAEVELMIAASRFEFDKNADASKTAGDQATLFPLDRDRDELERSLAYILGPNLPRPSPFAWIEIVAHWTDDELEAAWSWATAPQNRDQPACITSALAGELDRYEHDPILPATIYTTDAADARIGDHLSVEIDETGRVVVSPTKGPPQEVGRLKPSQTLIPVFAAIRLIAAAHPRWNTGRDDWTWKNRDKARDEVRADREAAKPRMPPKRKPEAAPAPAPTPTPAANDEQPHALDDIPVTVLLDAVRASKGSLTESGKILGITRDAMRRRCERHGIDYKAMKL